MSRLNSLPQIESIVWGELERASAQPNHPWRTPVLATVTRDGTGADARTVVIREVDAHQRQFLIYSDERAGKVSQLLHHPHATLVMWSQTLSWQLRCPVRLTLESSGLAASSRWARVKLSPAAQDYLSPLPPGTPVAEPHPARDKAVERQYFCVVCADVLSIDWLELHPDGHRRARLQGPDSTWLVP